MLKELSQELADLFGLALPVSLKQHDVDLSFTASASPEWFTSLQGVRSAAPGRSPHEVHLAVQGELHDVIKVAAQYGATNIVTREPSLEEIFLRFYEPERSPAAVNR